MNSRLYYTTRPSIVGYMVHTTRPSIEAYCIQMDIECTPWKINLYIYNLLYILTKCSTILCFTFRQSVPWSCWSIPKHSHDTLHLWLVLSCRFHEYRVLKTIMPQSLVIYFLHIKTLEKVSPNILLTWHQHCNRGHNYTSAIRHGWVILLRYRCDSDKTMKYHNPRY